MHYEVDWQGPVFCRYTIPLIYITYTFIFFLKGGRYILLNVYVENYGFILFLNTQVWLNVWRRPLNPSLTLSKFQGILLAFSRLL